MGTMVRIAVYGKAGKERLGIVKDNKTMIDIDKALESKKIHETIASFLLEPDWLRTAEHLHDAAESLPEDCYVDATGTRLGSVAAGASKILAVGANTWSHLREAHSLTRSKPPREPFIIAKLPSSASGPYDDIAKPSWVSALDYEVELGVVIGRKCKGVSKSESMEYVAGYTATNDLTARDIQIDAENQFFNQHTLSKSFDTFCPAGPHLVTKDEIDDPEDLTLRLWVNGELRQDGSTSDLVFGVPALISYISRAVTLYPGDVILTGSPAGVAYFMKPQRFLRVGDVITASVGKVGDLRNRVVEA